MTVSATTAPPVTDRREQRSIWVLAVATIALGHIAIVLTCPGVGAFGFQKSLAVLYALSTQKTRVDDVELAPLSSVLMTWAGLVLVFLLVVAAIAVVRGRRRLRRGGSAKGLATVRDFRRKNRQLEQAEPFAYLNQKPIFAREDDTGAVLGTTGGGKTTRVVVQWIKRAEGAVISTSTKPEVVRLTAKHRATLGKIFVFDPEAVMRWPQRIRWNLVAGCEVDQVAMERARALVSAQPLDGNSKNSGFFSGACETILRCMLHAAALENRSMRDVLRWTRNFTIDEPFDILHSNPQAASGWVDDLTKYTRGAATETISSTEQTLSNVLQAFSVSAILDSVCPTAGEGFDVEGFVHSTDTLYLLTQSGGKALAAPVITALVESLQRAATRAATLTPSGKLSPAFTNALDEVPNVCPIPSLESIMSDGRGHGIRTLVVAQDRPQLVSRFGNKANSILGNATIFFLLGGSKDATHLRELSDLSGHRLEERMSVTRSGDSRSSTSTSLQREPIVAAAHLAQLPEGRAFLRYRELPPALVQIPAWYESADKADYEESIAWTLQVESS